MSSIELDLALLRDLVISSMCFDIGINTTLCSGCCILYTSTESFVVDIFSRFLADAFFSSFSTQRNVFNLLVTDAVMDF